MTKIKNICLQFSCPEKLEANSFCSKCSNHIVDFTNKTNKDLREEIGNSNGRVCGLFKKSQLSNQFLKYAAATVIATAIAVPASGQKVFTLDSLQNESEKSKCEHEEEVIFGMIVETQAMPIGGYPKFFESIARVLKYPEGLTEKGRTFVEFTIDTLGRMADLKVVKGFNELADKEAVRVFSILNYPFEPGRQRGKAVRTRVVVPILFDPKNKVKE